MIDRMAVGRVWRDHLLEDVEIDLDAVRLLTVAARKSARVAKVFQSSGLGS